MTTYYEITANGVSMGIFASDNDIGAFDAYARDAGYASYPALLAATDGSDDATATEVEHTLFDFDEDGDTIVPGYDATAFRVFVEPLDGAVRVTVYAVEGPDGEHVKLLEEVQLDVAFNLDAALSAATRGLENARSAHERAVDEYGDYVAWVSVGKSEITKPGEEGHADLLNATITVKTVKGAIEHPFAEWIDDDRSFCQTATAWDEGGEKDNAMRILWPQLGIAGDGRDASAGEVLDAIYAAACRQLEHEGF